MWFFNINLSEYIKKQNFTFSLHINIFWAIGEFFLLKFVNILLYLFHQFLEEEL
jgi:hypothetical protein